MKLVRGGAGKRPTVCPAWHSTSRLELMTWGRARAEHRLVLAMVALAANPKSKGEAPDEDEAKSLLG